MLKSCQCLLITMDICFSHQLVPCALLKRIIINEKKILEGIKKYYIVFEYIIIDCTILLIILFIL